MHPLWTQTACTVTAIFCVNQLVSKFCSFSIPNDSKFNLPHRMCFIETVLVICILSQNSNPETLSLHLTITLENSNISCSVILSEWKVTSDVNLLENMFIWCKWALLTGSPLLHFPKGCHYNPSHAIPVFLMIEGWLSFTQTSSYPALHPAKSPHPSHANVGDHIFKP